ELLFHLHPTEPLVAVSSHFGNAAQVLEVPSGKVKKTFPFTFRGHGVEWSPDGRLVAITDGPHLTLYETGSYRRVRQLALDVGHGAPPYFNNRGDLVMVTGWNATWQLFDVRTGQRLVHTDPVPGLIYRPLFLRGDDHFGPVSVDAKMRLFRVWRGAE